MRLVFTLVLLLMPVSLSADDLQSAGAAIALGNTKAASEILSKPADQGDAQKLGRGDE